MTDQPRPRPYYDPELARRNRQDLIGRIKRVFGFGRCEVLPVSEESMRRIAKYKAHGRENGAPRDEGG